MVTPIVQEFEKEVTFEKPTSKKHMQEIVTELMRKVDESKLPLGQVGVILIQQHLAQALVALLSMDSPAMLRWVQDNYPGHSVGEVWEDTTMGQVHRLIVRAFDILRRYE